MVQIRKTGMTPMADVLAELRRGDRPRQWLALLAPASCRAAVVGLYGLNLELRRIPALAREPGLAAIRYQWWRQALAAAVGGAPADHPVLALLCRTVGEGSVSAEALAGLIDAMEGAGEDTNDAAAFEARALDTTGRLFRLAAGVLMPDGAGRDLDLDQLALAWARMAVLRAPGRIVDAREAAARAREHLDAAPALPRGLGAVGLHGDIARANLASLARAGFDRARCRWADQGGLLPARLYWRVLTRRV